jgi:flavin-binding protein dodecin
MPRLSRAARFRSATPVREFRQEATMSKVVKVIEVLSESPKSWEDAAGNAVKEAQKSLRDVKSIYIKDLSAEVDNGKIVNFRITAKLSFKLE